MRRSMLLQISMSFIYCNIKNPSIELKMQVLGNQNSQETDKSNNNNSDLIP
jgi:hypothetical protein